MVVIITTDGVTYQGTELTGKLETVPPTQFWCRMAHISLVIVQDLLHAAGI